MVGVGEVGDEGGPSDDVATVLGGSEGEHGLFELATLGKEVDELGMEEGDREGVGGDEVGVDLRGMPWVGCLCHGGISEEGGEMGESERGVGCAMVVME
ncbi:hypothetical protein OPV22_026650 [Ensete ventricosum]|uniref:Uncharacterized protein n=1 Tax=Ensete ventricosum TaxID=4639 RepID=A0AAV8QKI1_ENSVE|nr:hypothetical protein OPV22_026650 [Ensete ventricosum]